MSCRLARACTGSARSIVNSYLIADQDGVTIIDAGLPGYWKLVQAELAAMGKSLSDVRALILTHGDTDHIGFAARLHRETGVAAHIHEADADRARLKVKKPNSGWGPVKIGPLARLPVVLRPAWRAAAPAGNRSAGHRRR